MQNERYGYVYKIINHINNKIYVGQHKGSTLDEHYWGSGRLIKKAINKEGLDMFSIEVLEWCSSKENLNDREKYWIDYLDAINPDIGYNLTTGGDGVKGYVMSWETKDKIRLAKIGFKHSDKTRQKIRESIIRRGGFRGERNPNYGKRLNDDQRKLLSEKIKESDGMKDSPRFSGHSHSEESKAKISESVKQRRFTMTCKICGEVFEARSNRSLYCDLCKLHKSKGGGGRVSDFKRKEIRDQV